MNTTQFFATQWLLSPLALLSAVAALLYYLRRVGWSSRAGWMGAAIAAYLLAFMSPLAVLARGYLFSAHMLQHILLLLLVPALVLLALPPSAQPSRQAARILNPLVCWGCGVAGMWVWHLPALCNAAAQSQSVSAVQTLTLLLMGAAFWWQILAPCEAQRIAPLHGVIYLFAACLACSALGIILTFSPVTVCAAYLHPGDALGISALVYGTWGMTPMRDQQIGGLLMWVPMCMVYLGAIFGQLARWYAAPARTAHGTLRTI